MVTITGTYVNALTGAPHTGRGYIEPTTLVVRDLGGGVTAGLGGVPFVLDAAGAFTVDVPATDDPDLSPPGFTYRLGVYLTDATPTRLADLVFAAPAGLVTIDVADLVTVATPLAPTQYTELDARLDALALSASRPDQVTWTRSGALSVFAGTTRLYNDTGAARTLDQVRAAVGTPPGGGPVVVDVQLDGATVFPTTPRPTVAAGASTGVAVPDTTAWPADSYLTVSVTAVGASPAGADLTVTITYR